MVDREPVSNDFLKEALDAVKGELENKRIPRTQRVMLESLKAVMMIQSKTIVVDHERVEEMWMAHQKNQTLFKRWEPRLWAIVTGALGYILGVKL